MGFIYTQPFDWGVPLYRLYKSVDTDYFLTVSEFEKDYAIENYGFSEDLKVGYVSPIGILNPDSRLKFNIAAGYGTKVGNGNYRYSHTDLRIPGIGMPLVFSRTYNSLNCGADGPLGHGWTHSYQARLIDDGTRVFVFWPDGHADYYNKHDNMTQTNPATAENTGCYDTLYESDPNSDKQYTITRKDQTKYIFKIPESSFDPESPKAPFDVAQFTSIEDKNGKSIALTYDLNTGNLTTIRDTANRAITFTYYGDSEGNLGHIKTITDPAGRTLTFKYDSLDNLTTATDARGNVTTFEYDSTGYHLLTKVTLPENQALANSYEDFKVKSQTIDGKTFDFSFTDTSATVTAPGALAPTRYSLSINQVHSNTDPLGYSASIPAFDGANPTRPKTITNKNNKNTTFTYNDGSGDTGKTVLNKGNVLTVTNTLGETTTYTYDEKNNLLTKKDALNHETQYGYDTTQRNLVKITYPEGGIQRFTYTSNGQVETATDPDGHIITYTYDPHGNVTRVTDHLTNHVDFTYDGVGRMLTRTDPLGRRTTYAYDPNSNLTQVTDANGKSTTYTYNKNNNLTRVTNAKGKATTYAYNNRNLFSAETNPLTKTYQYGYDDRSNVGSITDPDGNQTTYGYDADNRLTGILYKGVTKVSITEYDGNGNLKKLKTDSTHETAFTYDDLNRIKTCTGPFGKAVSYEYDAAGNRTKITYPGEKSVTYTYDSDNRLIKVTDWLGGVAAYAYDSAGILQTIVNPNGTTTTYSYDAANRLTGLSNKKSNGAVIAGFTYTLDAAGNHTLVEKDEPITPEFTATDISYTYDDADRLTAAGGTNYTHDNRGNMTGTSAGNTYTFDFASRVTRVASGGENIDYLYDGLGNRIARTQGGVQARYVLDLNRSMSQVLAETDSSGDVTNYYVYGHGLISKITADGNRYSYHFDSRGSTVGMTDGSENLVNKYAYDEYGGVLNSSEDNANPFRYVGKYGVMDEGNGLLFMRARYYDSDTGRFLSKDPLRGELVDPGTLNRYVYVLGNPVMGVDPEGLEEVNPSLVKYAEYTIKLTTEGWNALLLEFGKEIMAIGFANYLSSKGYADEATAVLAVLEMSSPFISNEKLKEYESEIYKVQRKYFDKTQELIQSSSYYKGKILLQGQGQGQREPDLNVKALVLLRKTVKRFFKWLAPD